MHRPLNRLAPVLCCALLAPHAAHAVEFPCTFTNSHNLHFAPDVLAGTNLSTFAQITLSCEKPWGSLLRGVNVCLSIKDGNAPQGHWTPRALKSASGQYAYFQIYTDSSYQTFWGDGTDNAHLYPRFVKFDLPFGVLSGSASVDMYARLVPTATVPLHGIVPGTYTNNFNGNKTHWRSSLRAVFDPANPVTCNPEGVYSSTGSFPFEVTLVVEPACKITTPSIADMAFADTTGPIALEQNASTSFQVQCTNTTPYSIALDQGAHASGAQRRMQLDSASSADYVHYNLYRDSARSIAWNASSTLSGTGSGQAQNHTVYGRVPAGQNPGAGNYKDTVTVTVTY